MPSYNVNDIVEYHDMFNLTDHSSILKYTELDKWKWGHSSNPGEDKIPPFWIMDLSNEKFFTEYLLKKIEKQTNQESVLVASLIKLKCMVMFAFVTKIDKVLV